MMEVKLLKKYRRHLARLDKLLEEHKNWLISPEKDDVYQAILASRYALAKVIDRFN